MLEIDIKRSFRRFWDGWCSFNEFGLGGDSGAPDLYVLVGTLPVRLLPIELKRGELKTSGIVVPHRVRPAQIRWHTEFGEAGGLSVLLIGVPPFENEFYAVPSSLLSRWSSGYMVGSEAKLINPLPKGKGLKKELERFLGIGYRARG